MTILTEDFDKLDGVAPAVKDIGYVTFSVEEMRLSASGMATIVESKVNVYLVAGIMTTPNLEPGPAKVRVGSGGKTYRIVIPVSATPVRLWPLIEASVLLPPATTDQRIAQAVAAYLVAHPPSGGGGGSATVDTLGGTGAVGRNVMKADTQAAARSILNAASTAEVAAAVAALVNSSPAALDTLQELAAALGNDPNFASTIAGQIGAKYTKPGAGIPKADLVSAVQASLDKADTSRTSQQVSDAIAAALTGYVQLPAGGADGQVLTKSGAGLVWTTLNGSTPSTDGALAQASAAYKAAAKAAGTSRLKVVTIADSTGDGYGNPGGPDTWAKTWPLKLAALLRTHLGVAAGGRGWVGASTPLAPANYVWTPPSVSGGNGSSRDDLTTQIGIPGSLWLQKGHATNVDTVTFPLSAGVTAVDVITTGYSGNMVITAANAGSSITKDSTGDRVFTRITNPGATVAVTGAAGVGFAVLGVIEYIGDTAVGVTQWNLSRGAMRAFEYADWLTQSTFSLKPIIGTLAPHVALVCLGANDYQTGRTTAQFGTALTSIFNQIRSVSASTEVVFIIRPLADSGATTWNTYNETLQSTAASLGARVLDARGLSGSGLYVADGVHFTEAGNTAMANLVLDFMKVAA